MKLRYIFFIPFLCLAFLCAGQKYKAESSRIHFFSDAPMEDIEAINTKSSSVFDLATGNIVFSVPMNQFQFDKSLMQQHFNENYLESDKYPKAIFLGKMNVTGLKEGENSVLVSGEMDLHGVKKEIEVLGTMTKRGDKIAANAKFTILLKDYNIKIPKAVFYNIAEEITITIDFNYVPN